MVTIIDYGMGNLESVANMLKRIGARSIISSDPGEISAAEKLILPGVGSFDAGMDNLNRSGIASILRKKTVEDKTPLLGICLGMQLLADKSEEGISGGLGLVAGQVKRFVFEPSSGLKIPHMGWNAVKTQNESRLFSGFGSEARFYFVHSYHFVCQDSKDIAATTDYGGEFISAVEKGNILGVQFHPEKSHRFGMALMKNFVELY